MLGICIVSVIFGLALLAYNRHFYRSTFRDW